LSQKRFTFTDQGWLASKRVIKLKQPADFSLRLLKGHEAKLFIEVTINNHRGPGRSNFSGSDASELVTLQQGATECRSSALKKRKNARRVNNQGKQPRRAQPFIRRPSPN
jgi:hypothetical protein